VCFFCRGNDHSTRDCEKRTIAPNNGEPTQCEITIGGDDDNVIQVWNFCTKCKKWQGHDTSQHRDDVAVGTDCAASGTNACRGEDNSDDEQSDDEENDEIDADIDEMENVVESSLPLDSD
jgi:hypothetical protein